VIFLWFVFVGYIAGIFHKIVNSFDWVIVIYSMNACMVFIDIFLYYVYSKQK